jgi:hypothetical protein
MACRSPEQLENIRLGRFGARRMENIRLGPSRGGWLENIRLRREENVRQDVGSCGTQAGGGDRRARTAEHRQPWHRTICLVEH